MLSYNLNRDFQNPHQTNNKNLDIMKLNRIFLAALMTAAAANSFAENEGDNSELKYRRSSLYSVMVNHTDQNFANEIREAFAQMPVPDKYNDHDLSVKVLNLNKKLKNASSDEENQDITSFLENNNVGSRLVAKWFDRDYYTGTCDMDLIKERGLYNASKFDLLMAEKSERSKALIMDAGEDLIGNTFVLVNDIRYIDKSKGSKVVGGIFKVLGAVAAAYTGNNNFSDIGDNLGDIAESLKGFSVKINTFLYKLDWNDDIAMSFYNNQYTADGNSAKKEAFDLARGNYKLKYIGKQESSGSTTSFIGIKDDEPIMMVRKACQRALDENVASLQKNFEEFKTKSPLVTTEPLTAYIGLKEGVSEKSKFEVLEAVEDEQGKVSYKRVGIIKPISSLIWDNRYMAEEECAPNSTLGATTFKKESGGDFYQGMLIREIE